jgi:hypothetical protein
MSSRLLQQSLQQHLIFSRRAIWGPFEAIIAITAMRTASTATENAMDFFGTRLGG